MNIDYALHPISKIDGRLKEQRRLKKKWQILRGIIILSITIFYVIHSIFTARAASDTYYPIQPTPSVVVPTQEPLLQPIAPSQSPVLATPTPQRKEQAKKTTQSKGSVPKPKRKGIYRFASAYNGSKVTKSYLDELFRQCGDDVSAVSRVVGIALAETGLGRDTKKSSNFYGWHPNGNRAYDPSVGEMARIMCKAVNGSYRHIGVNRAVTKTYTGGDGVDGWIKRYNWAMSRMAVE